MKALVMGETENAKVSHSGDLLGLYMPFGNMFVLSIGGDGQQSIMVSPGQTCVMLRQRVGTIEAPYPQQLTDKFRSAMQWHLEMLNNRQ